MKKHEACYYLNVIRRDLEGEFERSEKNLAKPTIYDRDTKQVRDATPKEAEEQAAYLKKCVTEKRNQIEAIDIAASALTK